MKLLILTLCLFCSASLFARDAATKKDHNCASDQKKFCKGIKKGKNQIEKCLKKHKNELSKSCEEKISGKKEKKSAKKSAKKVSKNHKKLTKKKKRTAYYNETPMTEVKEAKQEISPDAVQMVLPDTNVIEPAKL